MKNIMVGKREFIQHTSHYLKQAEKDGNIIITHHGKPELRLSRLAEKSVKDLKGLIKHIKIIGDINEPVLPGYDEW